MIQPARATARFQGFQFPRERHLLRAGGRVRVRRVEARRLHRPRVDGDSDYEFILDLPPVELDASPYPIGNTDRFPHNTIVLRPRLLRDLRFIQALEGGQAEPKIEVIRPDDPTKAPSQVKITIPQGALGRSIRLQARARLAPDPAREQARRVKLSGSR